MEFNGLPANLESNVCLTDRENEVFITLATFIEEEVDIYLNYFEGVLDKFSLIPIFFFKKVEILISLEVYTCAVTAC